MTIRDKLEQINEKYKQEKPNNLFEFNREALLSFDGLNTSICKDVVILLCVFLDIKEYRESLNIELMNNQIRQKYLLDVSYKNDIITVKEYYTCYYYPKDKQLYSYIPDMAFFTGESKDYIKIDDYRTISGISRKDIQLLTE